MKKTIEIIKKLRPDLLFAVGGPHPSAYGAELVRDGVADYVFYGEAEVGFVKLLDFLKQENYGRLADDSLASIPGLIYIDRAGEVKKNAQSLENDLDKLGTLDYSYLSLSKYQEKGYTYGGKVLRATH